MKCVTLLTVTKKNNLGKKKFLENYKTSAVCQGTKVLCSIPPLYVPAAYRFSGLQVLILIARSIAPKSFPLDVSPLPKSPRGTSDKTFPFPYRTPSSLMLNYPLSCPLIIISLLQIAIKF